MFNSKKSNYDAARKVWNGMIDKHPALIVRCTGVADVISAVNFARTNKLLVAGGEAAITSPGTQSAMGASLLTCRG